MKQLLTLLLLIPTLVFGQGNTTITANDTTFSMGGVLYNRGDVNLAIPTADSTRCAILSAYDGHVIILQKAISKYKRSNGAAFTAVSLCAFFDSFMTVQVSGGGSSTIIAGTTPVTSGYGVGNVLLDATVATEASTFKMDIGTEQVSMKSAKLGLTGSSGFVTFSGATSGTYTEQAPASITSYTVTVPSAQGGANTYLKNNGSGLLSWDTPAGGGGSGALTLYADSLTLSSSNLLNLFATPLTLVSAKGAGTIIVPAFIVCKYTYGTATYSTQNILFYEVASPSQATNIIASWKQINNTSTITSSCNAFTTTNIGSVYVENSALKVTSVAALTTGDGTLKINVYYYVIISN